VFVSKFDHCLADLLYRYQSGELHCETADHPQQPRGHALAGRRLPHPVSAFHGHKDAKHETEQVQLAILAQPENRFHRAGALHAVAVGGFHPHFPNRIINIHHSFLPAFHGAKPYHRAFERGVKLIGATRTTSPRRSTTVHHRAGRGTISHRDSLDDLINKGADLEKVVLSRAVKWHLDNRVLVYANKTVVFD